MTSASRPSVLMLFGAVIAMLGANAVAQDAGFPEKGRIVELTSVYPPGDSTDLSLRLLADVLAKELNTSVIVSNKPGANGQIGITSLVRSKPDGYSIALVGASATAISYSDPARKVPFSRKDFLPLVRFTKISYVLSVNDSLPYKTLADLIAAAKARPGEIKLGSTALLSGAHVNMLLLEKTAGVRFKHVPFQGVSQAALAVRSGDIDVLISGVSTILTSEGLRTLAVFDDKRQPALPDAPTAREQGFDVAYPAYFGLILPAGTPHQVVDKLSTALGRAMTDTSMVDRLRKMDVDVAYQNADDFGKFWDTMDARAASIVSFAAQRGK